jgi:transcription antitermination factor NusG
MDATQPWFALQTKPRSEKKIDYLLQQKGYESFTPTYRRRRRWADRTVEIELPLLPMYVFCRLNSSAMGKAVTTPGVVRIVGFGGKPAEILMEEINALQLLARSPLLREPWRYLPDGTMVLVETGPLAGTRGIISHDDNCRRLIISVTLLQRSVAIQLDENTVVSTIPGYGGNVGAEADLAVSLLKKNVMS